jgi:hypothetical protein
VSRDQDQSDHGIDEIRVRLIADNIAKIVSTVLLVIGGARLVDDVVKPDCQLYGIGTTDQAIGKVKLFQAMREMLPIVVVPVRFRVMPLNFRPSYVGAFGGAIGDTTQP